MVRIEQDTDFGRITVEGDNAHDCDAQLVNILEYLGLPYPPSLPLKESAKPMREALHSQMPNKTCMDCRRGWASNPGQFRSEQLSIAEADRRPFFSSLAGVAGFDRELFWACAGSRGDDIQQFSITVKIAGRGYACGQGSSQG